MAAQVTPGPNDAGFVGLQLVVAEPVTGVRAVAKEPLLSPTKSDEDAMAWYAAWASSDVSGLHSGTLERGGSFSVTDHDKMTVRQEKAATRHRRLSLIYALLSAEHRATIFAYWNPGCARLRVERERENEERKLAGKALLAPHADGELALRIAMLGPDTRAAQEAGRLLVHNERMRERARQTGRHLKLVTGPKPPEPVDGAEDAAAPDVAAPQVLSDPGQRLKIRLDNGEVVEADEDASRAMYAFAAGDGDVPGSLGYAIRIQAAAANWHRQRVQGPWKPAPLAPDQLRDAAVRAIRDAERRKDIVLLSEIRVQAAKAYAAAGDAYVRARRTVKGKDGEEKRQEAADRWTRENACRNLRSEAQEFFAALESSSRIRSAT